MVDFKKLRAEAAKPKPIDPLEIFRRQPKPPEINDLYINQAEVLNEWNKRRAERDIAIKLHTGGGKTLVGLLVGQSILKRQASPFYTWFQPSSLSSRQSTKPESMELMRQPMIAPLY